MNTRFHVPSKVFGTRRSRGERPDGDPGSQSETSVVPASICVMRTVCTPAAGSPRK